MTTIERIQNYIKKENLVNNRYGMSILETLAIRENFTGFEAISLAFDYGRAKGLREGRAEARKNERIAGF